MSSHGSNWRTRLLLVLGLLAPSRGLPDGLPNGGFENGQNGPGGWSLVGAGEWATTARTGRRSLAVFGKADSSDYWRTSQLKLAPGRLYRFSFWARADRAASGCIISGPSFCNRDFRLQGAWRRHSFVFVTPPKPADAFVRLGHWHAPARVWFDDAELHPVAPLHARRGGVELGAGEEIDGSTYTFTTTLNGEGANFSRTLQGFNCGFNSDRWCFGGGEWLVYRFAPPARQLSATLELNCNYHVRGSGVVELSRDGKEWSRVGQFDKVGRLRLEAPATLFPTEALFLRLRALADANFQVNDIRYGARLEKSLPYLAGATTFIEVLRDDGRFPVEVLSVPMPGGNDRWRVRLANRTNAPQELRLTATVAPETGQPQSSQARATLPAGASTELSLRLPLTRSGRNALGLKLEADGAEVFRAAALVQLAALDDASYGRALPSPPGCRLWWCESARKVSRTRPAPEKASPAIELAAARGESEAVQLVLHPSRPLRVLSLRLDSLRAAQAELPRSSLRARVVEYVRITHPTDAAGSRGWWPDPLPPLEDGRLLAEGVNNPLWLTFHIPRDQPAGLYHGRLAVVTDRWTAAIPLRVRVWDFALPKSPHLQSAFGLNVGNIRRYHNLATDAELRQVFDHYMRSFAEHRIAPYDPAALDPIRVSFTTGQRQGAPGKLEARMDFTAFDRACERYLDGLGFNSIMVRLRGLGGGTFHARHKGQIGPFTQGTPEYEKLMASQGHQLVEHLRKKGWLEKAYLYWFDEPAPRDYPFVVEGMKLIKRAAPGLTRMLTEQPEPPLFGHVDLWCPVLSSYDHKVGAQRQKLGERFWWYLCCGPKAPYIGLFIDRPAVTLRVWAWLSRKWGIAGHLVWSTNYWTSSCAFPPPALQNPWDDPMSYVSGYGRKPGQIGYWGNGDGRFLYPPNRQPGKDHRRYLCGPVPSIRWEMLRDGVEDYDYFCILDRLIAQAEKSGKAPDLVARARKLASVPDQVVTDGRTYSKDPGPLLAHRRRLGEMIERLARALN